MKPEDGRRPTVVACRRLYCYRPSWQGRKLCRHHTMLSRRHMAARRARVKVARQEASKRLGLVVTKGRPRGDALQRQLVRLTRSVLPRWP